MNTTAQTTDVYQIITNRIIQQLEKEVIPWRKPWAAGGHPQNLFTKRYYTGINTWLLGSLGYAQNYFLTWKQIKAVGASVIKGEQAAMVLFYKPSEGQGESILRYYWVYNVEQVEHLPEILTIPYPPDTVNQLSACDEIIERMPNCPTIKHGKQAAFYDAVKDYINMPKQGSFGSIESYYSVLFHELIHSTGHPSRLNRKEIAEPNAFASDSYSIEELTAEIGACYLNSIAGIINKEFDNSARYIKGWIDVLKDNTRMIVYASGQAQRATDYILQVQSYWSKVAMQELTVEAQ